VHDYYQIPKEYHGLVIIPISIASFVGPIILGPLFDLVGRKKMIIATCNN